MDGRYSLGKYSLGLDIGTSSVGWAVLDLDKERIHDLGVRIFERPEHPKSGDSLAKPRRNARSARRRLKRRRQRLNNLKRFFVNQSLLTVQEIETILDSGSNYNKLDVYVLRAKAVENELSPVELFKVMYQIAKRRGFKSNRKVVEESDKEGGRVSKALKANEKFLLDNNYKSVGTALAQDEKYIAHKRNKRDNYTNSFAREDFLKELELIIQTQKNYALKSVPKSALRELIYGLDDDQNVINQSAIMYQRPFITRELIEKMVGNCTFEKGEKRAPKASFSFESFRLAADLSHLVFIPRDINKCQAKRENSEITLTPEQISKVIEAAKNQKSLTYKKVRQVAGISDDYVPKDARGKKKAGDDYGEKNDFGGLKAYQDIKSALKKLPEDWAKVDNENTINQIAYILTTQKADEGIRAELDKLPISDSAKTAITKIRPTNFKTFGHLSLKALQKITPYILKGMTYDKACEAAGYDFRKQSASLEQITNPVVKRAISQTLKVVRAIERKYGKPYYIKVETARDLAKNFEDRRAIKRENEENQARNQRIINTLKENGILTPTGQQIIKVKLYLEQNGVCLYSGEEIDFETMLRDDNAYQIDHIVPFSRSNNDGLTNKVLVKTEENQKKANRTPFEYFGADEQKWKEFVARVESTYKTRDVKTSDKSANHDNYKFNGYAMKKKQNLLLQIYKNDSWNVRALNDTRYITRFVQNYLRQNVQFADGDDKRRVIAPGGTITAYLRKRWGLSKDRSEDVLHHAKDAAVVAAIDNKILYQANLFAKEQEMKLYLSNAKTIEEKKQILDSATDKENGEIIDDAKFSQAQKAKAEAEYFKLRSDERHKNRFPQPWPDFGKEIMKRTLNTDVATLQNELRGLENYDEEFRLSVKPIFVSRMAKRKATGSAHEETLYSPKIKNGNQRSKRISIKSIRLCDLENTFLDKNDNLIQQISSIIKNSEKYKTETSEKKKNNIKLGDVFKEDIYKANKKVDKNGNPISPVSSLKVYSTKTSGYLINNNNAYVENGDTICLNIYKHKFGYYAAPVYMHLKNEKYFPIRPTPKGKNKTEKEYWNKLKDDRGNILSVPENGFEKICSIFPNEYVKIVNKEKRMKEGYYVKFGVGNGNIVLVPHHVPEKNDKNHINVGVGTIGEIQKTEVNVLGDNYGWS